MVLAAFVVAAMGVIHPAVADTATPTTTLALSAEPHAGGPALLDESAPPAKGATAAEAGHGASPWWVWVLIGAAAAGVAALVVTSSGSKDPACPSDRVCQ